MDDPLPAADLVRRCREGDAEAARQLFGAYAQRLSRLAEGYLSRKLAGRVDGEDVVQSAFRTFFRRAAAGEFQIDSAAQLWQLLVRITVLKARGQGRRHAAARRDVAAERSPAGEDWLVELASREPGPEEAVILLDQIESLLAGLPPVYARILELRLQGHSVREIVPSLNVARRTVYRALEVLQQRLERAV